MDGVQMFAPVAYIDHASRLSLLDAWTQRCICFRIADATLCAAVLIWDPDNHSRMCRHTLNPQSSVGLASNELYTFQTVV